MITTTSYRDRDGLVVVHAEGWSVGVYIRAAFPDVRERTLREQAVESVEDIEAGRLVVELHASMADARHAVFSDVRRRAAWRIR